MASLYRSFVFLDYETGDTAFWSNIDDVWYWLHEAYLWIPRYRKDICVTDFYFCFIRMCTCHWESPVSTCGESLSTNVSSDIVGPAPYKFFAALQSDVPNLRCPFLGFIGFKSSFVSDFSFDPKLLLMCNYFAFLCLYITVYFVCVVWSLSW